MKYDDRLSVIGIYKDRLMLFIIELLGEEYIIKKAVNLGKQDKLAIHSILNKDSSVYLADSYNNKIYKFNYLINELSEEAVGRDPRHMCMVDNQMYVANFESDNISVIDLTSFSLTESIPAGIKPHDVIFNKDNEKLYMCCYEENEVIEFTRNHEITRHFKTNGKPMHMFVFDSYIILMTYSANGDVHTKINFINLNTGLIDKVIVIDGLASDFDIDYKNKMLFVINIEDKNLYIIDILKKQIVKLIFLGGYPEDLTVGERFVYISNSKKNQIMAIDCDKYEIDHIVSLNFTPNCIKLIEDQR